MTMCELALLFPPLTRFFLGVLLIVGIVTTETLFALFIYMKYYGKD